MKTRFFRLFVASLLLVSSTAVHADPVADFYRGKQISMIVPSGVGGGYDLYTRFLARFYGKFIPGNPTFVVRNVPGASGITAANNLYSLSAPDGLTLGIFQNTITLNQLAAMSSVKFDVRKFSWIGNMATASTICVLSGPAKEAKAAELFQREFLIGATNMIPALMNSLAGTKFKIVSGYVSMSNVQLAMESGEVHGLCGWSWDGARVNGRDMLNRDVIRVALDVAIQPQPELQEMKIPFIMDMLPEGENKEALKVILSTQVYNRPFGGPPGIPSDRLAALRKGFADALVDPEFKTEADKIGLDLAYLPPEKILDLIELALGAPKQIQAKAVEELAKAGF